MAVVIVAIPTEEDYVRRISSEKVPHMTLLYLGDKIENIKRVEEYVGHVVRTSASKFGMDVERRGLLGDESADVLFFGEHGRSGMENVRRYLLADPDIQKAYNSADQYPEWIPHLTLGYPETPAKTDDREYPGISWVNFDRIAVWTGDYEGVEFLLTNDDNTLSMADRGKTFLEHYGVKGMKWGVIRATPGEVGSVGKRLIKEAYKPSADAVEAQRIQTRAKLGGVKNLNNREMQRVINRMHLERQYKELYGEQQWTNAGKKWAANFVTDVLKDVTSSWLRNPFAKRSSSRDPVRVDAWTTGQEFAGQLLPANRRAIGR